MRLLYSSSTASLNHQVKSDAQSCGAVGFTKDRVDRYSTDIIAENMQMLGGCQGAAADKGIDHVGEPESATDLALMSVFSAARLQIPSREENFS
jgi:hypothetical protein